MDEHIKEAQHIAKEFVAQLIAVATRKHISRKEWAEKVGVSESRLSQFLNHPSPRMRARTIVKYTLALGVKPAIVLYGPEPTSANGIVESWEKAGKPRDCFEVTHV